MNKQTTKPSLTKSDLLKLDIELPSMNEQRTFVDFVEQADKLKFNFLYHHQMVIIQKYLSFFIGLSFFLLIFFAFL